MSYFEFDGRCFENDLFCHKQISMSYFKFICFGTKCFVSRHTRSEKERLITRGLVLFFVLELLCRHMLVGKRAVSFCFGTVVCVVAFCFGTVVCVICC